MSRLRERAAPDRGGGATLPRFGKEVIGAGSVHEWLINRVASTDATTDATILVFDFQPLRLAIRNAFWYRSGPDCQAGPTNLADPASASPSLAKLTFRSHFQNRTEVRPRF